LPIRTFNFIQLRQQQAQQPASTGAHIIVPFLTQNPQQPASTSLLLTQNPRPPSSPSSCLCTGPWRLANGPPARPSTRARRAVVRPPPARLGPHSVPPLRLPVLLAPPQAPLRVLLVRGAGLGILLVAVRPRAVGLRRRPVPARRPARAPLPRAPLRLPSRRQRRQQQRPRPGPPRHSRSRQRQRRRDRRSQARQRAGARGSAGVRRGGDVLGSVRAHRRRGRPRRGSRLPRRGRRDGGGNGWVECWGGREEGEVLVEVLQAVEAVQLLAHLAAINQMSRQTGTALLGYPWLFFDSLSSLLFQRVPNLSCVPSTCSVRRCSDLLQAHGALLAASAARSRTPSSGLATPPASSCRSQRGGTHRRWRGGVGDGVGGTLAQQCRLCLAVAREFHTRLLSTQSSQQSKSKMRTSRAER